MSSEWKEYKLKDFARINPTERIPKGTIAKKIPMEFVQPFTKRIPNYLLEEYKGGVKFRNGDTLMARITPSLENGKISFVDILDEDEIGYGSTEYIVLRAKDNISDKHFLYYLAVSPTIRFTAIKSMTGSSGRQRVQTDVVKEHVFDAPELPEQRAIAAILSSLDDKIDLLHRQNQTLEQMAETLFRQWFVEEADEGWEEGRLGEFISTNETSINKNYPHQEIKYLDTGSLTKGQWGNLQSLHLVDAPSRAKRLVKHNDILYSTVRPNQLHYGIVRNPIENLVVSTGFCVITCKLISPYFVYYLLTDSGMTEYLHSIAEGSTSAYPSLKPSDLEALEISVPPSDILDKFHCFVDETWKKVETNYTQIRTLTALRDTLLPKLMSGEVRVQQESKIP